MRTMILGMSGGVAGLLLFATTVVNGAEEGKDKDVRPEPNKTSESFTDYFHVDKKNLGPTGRNPFFVLEPGYFLCYEEKDSNPKACLTITVLDETKMVDGVETRVVEEKETSGGKEKSCGRNYYAIDKRTNSIYYFGEDHGGAWESGKNGARFGLIMPGLPLVGARYYQEIAPNDGAMDCGTIVSVSEKTETPAGTFESCVKIHDTTVLEPTVRDLKIFAPGVGQIRDNDMVLVKYGPKK